MNTALARSGEGGGIGGDPIQALMPGTTQEQTDVGTGGTVWFCQIVAAAGGVVPDASSGDRIALAPNTGVFLRVPPLGKVAVHDGSAGGAFANAVQAGVTVVYVYYNSTAGTCYMTEMV
jgi:hypothetical protein